MPKYMICILCGSLCIIDQQGAEGYTIWDTNRQEWTIDHNWLAFPRFSEQIIAVLLFIVVGPPPRVVAILQRHVVTQAIGWFPCDFCWLIVHQRLRLNHI